LGCKSSRPEAELSTFFVKEKQSDARNALIVEIQPRLPSPDLGAKEFFFSCKGLKNKWLVFLVSFFNEEQQNNLSVLCHRI